MSVKNWKMEQVTNKEIKMVAGTLYFSKREKLMVGILSMIWKTIGNFIHSPKPRLNQDWVIC